MINKTTFKSGLRLLTIPEKNTTTATVVALVGTGSKYEEKRINGVSHFLEHMFFKGTKNRPTSFDVVAPIENVGGIFNAFTTQDVTGYFVKVDARHVDMALEIVADIFLNSVFSQEEIEKEKGVVIEEINMRKDAPQTRVWDLWEQVILGDQPAGWDVAGTKESVSGLKREDIVGYVNSQYVAKNTVIAVAGNIQEEKMAERVESLFQNVATGEFKPKYPVVPYRMDPPVFLETRKTDQTHLALGVMARNAFHKDRYAQDILAGILGDGMSSRMFMEIREKMGLAYYIYTASRKDPDTGFLATFAGVKNEYAERAVAAIVEEYRRIKDVRVSSQELRNGKDKALGGLAMRLEPSEVQAEFYGMQEVLENRFFSPEEVYGMIEEVTVQDIQRVAQELFSAGNLRLVAVGPGDNKESLEGLLSRAT
ncbi:MAG: insulinase family protein [Candidatus Wildermuthbacteria bacterium]|nr:insulinase family protein [Candidatus Wildermuthbacteria bacterium]